MFVQCCRLLVHSNQWNCCNYVSSVINFRLFLYSWPSEAVHDFLICDQAALRTLLSVRMSVRLDMLLENDGNFGEVINGTEIRPDSTHLSLYDILVQAPSWPGWVLYRQLELTKLTRPDLRYVVGLFILRDVRPSVHLLYLFDNVSLVFSSRYFQEYWQKWCPCKRSKSKVKVTEVKTPFIHFRTVTPVWIHIWRCNDAQNLMLLRRGVLLFFKVICQISRSHGTKKCLILTRIEHFRRVTQVWIHWWLWNDAQNLT